MSRTGMNIGHAMTGRTVVLVGLLLSVIPGQAHADAFDGYRLMRTFQLPYGAGPFEALRDGRIVTLVSDGVYFETAPQSGVFNLHGLLPGANLPSYGAAFIRVSPDGTKLAVGNNGGDESLPSDFEVGVFDVDSLTGTWLAAEHLDAAWINGTYLALTAGDYIEPSVVTALDTTSAEPQNPTNPIIIDNIGGASGGIAFDEVGNLYTGNGYALMGPSGTGVTMLFDHAAWTAALSGGAVPDFEVDGTLVVDILSASPLGFDGEGNLFVGGGDLYGSGEGDFVGLVRSSVVGEALLGMGPADPDDATQVRRLDPDTTSGFNFYWVTYNPTTRDLYLRDYGDNTVYVYTDVTAIPAVSEWGVVVMALSLATAATLMLQRRLSDGHQRRECLNS